MAGLELVLDSPAREREAAEEAREEARLREELAQAHALTPWLFQTADWAENLGSIRVYAIDAHRRKRKCTCSCSSGSSAQGGVSTRVQKVTVFPVR